MTSQPHSLGKLDLTQDLLIMAVDPGVTKMGIAILKAHPLRPNEMVVLSRYCIEGNKVIKPYKHLRGQYEDRFIVQIAFRDLFKSLIQEWAVNVVVSEGAFAFTRIAAFESLVKVISNLQWSMYDLGTITLPCLQVVSPQFVKKAWAGSGGKDVGKEEMRAQYYAATSVTGDLDKEAATEHEIDAVAHGYAWLSRDIWQTVVQGEKPKKKAKKIKLLA